MNTIKLKMGTIIHEQPYCHVLTPHFKEECCDQCFRHRQLGELKRCSGCKVVRYCSVQCQRQAWNVHKDECPALKKVAPKIPTDSVLLFYRLLILHQKGKHLVKQGSVFGERCFQDLMSHTDKMKEDFKRMKEFTEVMETLKIYTGDLFQLPSSAELLEIFGKVCINSFTICDKEMQTLGVGIYLGASHLDHSCTPNAIPTFDGVTLQISRIDGSAFQYSETFISYTDQLSTTQERQDELNSRYYFTCHCPRCDDFDQYSAPLALHGVINPNTLVSPFQEEPDITGLVFWGTQPHNLSSQRPTLFEDEEKLATVCQTMNCGGIIKQKGDGALRPCSVCKKADVGHDYISRKQSLITEVQETLENLKDLRKHGDFQEVLCRSKACLSKCSSFLPPSNVFRCRITDHALDACIELGVWEKAVEFGRDTLHCYRKFYDKCHPNLGIQLMKLGKIELYLKHLCEAARYLQEAESVLRLSHGMDHPLHKDLTSLLQQCMEEQRVQLEFEQQNS